MLTLTLAGAGISNTLTNWESHGQISDSLARSIPVFDDAAIAAINADPTSTWKAGRNPRFEGASLLDAKRLMGVLQSTDLADRLPAKKKSVSVSDIPDEFDWRTDPRAANCPSLAEVRDQANCGSCWAFGAVEAMTDRICLASNGTKNAHISAVAAMSCNKGVPPMGNMGCNGGISSNLYRYYATQGLVTGGNYGDLSGCWSYPLAPCAHHTANSSYPDCPDEVRAPACARKCVDSPDLDWEADKHHGELGYSVCEQGPDATPCAEAMKAEIYENGPITAQFFVYQSFTSYTEGVYQKKSPLEPMLGGHAIKIMGYGTEAGTPYWLVANSWNDNWGLGGFFKIKRGSNECQIEDAVLNGGPVAGMPRGI